MASRKQIEERILQIISYINQEKTLEPLIWSLKLFSLEELLKLKEFLENWNYKPIYILLDKKIKEYLDIMKQIKQIKIENKMKNIKKQEEKEDKLEQINIDNLIA